MIKGIKICGVSDLETLNYIVNHQFPPKFDLFVIIKKAKDMWIMKI